MTHGSTWSRTSNLLIGGVISWVSRLRNDNLAKVVFCLGRGSSGVLLPSLIPANNQTNIQQSQVQRPQEILATLMSGNSIAIVALPGALYPYYQVWGPFWPRHLSQTRLDLYQKLCGKIIEPYTVEPHRPQLNLTMHLTTLDIYNRYGLKMNHMMIGKGTKTYKNKNSFKAWHWVSILTLKSYDACLLNCFFRGYV